MKPRATRPNPTTRWSDIIVLNHGEEKIFLFIFVSRRPFYSFSPQCEQ